MGFLDDMKSDTTDILNIWGATITIKRKTVSYDDAGMATEAWANQSTPKINIQPVSGDTIQMEAGLTTKSTHEIYCEHDVDMEAGDRIYQDPAQTPHYTVNYVREFEDHKVAYCVFIEGKE